MEKRGRPSIDQMYPRIGTFHQTPRLLMLIALKIAAVYIIIGMTHIPCKCDT
jgi:hypothetical protein